MKVLLALTLFAVDVIAGDLDPRVFRLIGSDAKWVVGVDLDRYRNSALRNVSPASEAEGLKHLITIGRDSKRLLVFVGLDMTGEGESPSPYDGIMRLASNIGIAGDEDLIREARLRWSREDPLSEVAFKAQRLSRSYDNWFLAIRPLEQIAAEEPTQLKLKYREELVQVIEEASGGIRFGSVNEFYGEAVMKSAEDAAALATLGKWIPGFLQLKDAEMAQIVELAENLSIQSQGRTASISFRLEERRLKEMFQARRDDRMQLDQLDRP